MAGPARVAGKCLEAIPQRLQLSERSREETRSSCPLQVPVQVHCIIRYVLLLLLLLFTGHPCVYCLCAPVYTCTQCWVLALPGLALETFDDVQVLLLIYGYWIDGTASLEYSWKYIYGRGPFILYPPLVCSNSASYPTGRSCRPSLSQLETALRWTNQAQLSCVLVCIICSTYDLVGLEMQRAWRDSALRV